MVTEGWYSMNLHYSAKCASEELGLSHSNIIQVCKGKRKSANGMRFRYKDEN